MRDCVSFLRFSHVLDSDCFKGSYDDRLTRRWDSDAGQDGNKGIKE